MRWEAPSTSTFLRLPARSAMRRFCGDDGRGPGATVDPVATTASSLDAQTRRARVAITAVFALNGLLFGSWAARIPAVRDHVGASNGALGVALGCLAVGAIVAMPLAGALAVRVGSRRATRLALLGSGFVVAVVAQAPSLPVLFALTFLLGAGNGALDVTMNAHGVAIERRYGRPILSGMHAAFSAGGLVGAGLGALAAGAGVGVGAHLAVAAAFAVAVGVMWTRDLLPGHEDAAATGEHPLFVRPPRRLWALGALAFACLVVEGAAADWSAVYLRDDLDAAAGTAALGFTAFSVTMVLGRLFGDALVARVGPTGVVRAGGLVAAVGFALALAAATPLAAFAGLACLGAGMAGVVPIVFRASGLVDGIAPGVALAAVSSTGYLGFLAGPTIIGGTSELTGLPVALALLVALAAIVAALARTAAPRDAAGYSSAPLRDRECRVPT
ncbi:MAG: major facilitator superfamily 1 [Solirubrobacterales bacterium]|nr:major facilitator superfamily 1 [Solirubrobacterales bacterium]